MIGFRITVSRVITDSKNPEQLIETPITSVCFAEYAEIADACTDLIDEVDEITKGGKNLDRRLDTVVPRGTVVKNETVVQKERKEP